MLKSDAKKKRLLEAIRNINEQQNLVEALSFENGERHIQNLIEEGALIEILVIRKFRTTAADDRTYKKIRFAKDVNQTHGQLHRTKIYPNAQKSLG